MIVLPDTEGMELQAGAAAWAGLGLRLCYENKDGERPVGSWRYADRDKTKLLKPDTPDRARHLVEYYSITRLLVEPAKNMVVLDIDHRPEQGWDALVIGKALRTDLILPACPIVKTPSGGFHLWFQLPDGFRARNWTSQHGKFPIDGVDVRTLGGLAAVPPSTRRSSHGKSAGTYEWVGSCRAVPMASPALIEALTPPEYEAVEIGEQRPFVGDISRYCEAALENELSAVAQCPKGGRNLQLFKSAASLGGIISAGGLPRGSTFDALLSAASACGLLKEDGKRGVEATIQSGFVAGQQKPRQLPNSGGGHEHG